MNCHYFVTKVMITIRMIKAINAAAGKRKHTLVLFCSFQQVSFLTEALATQGYLFEVALWAHKGSKSASSGKIWSFFLHMFLFMWSAFKARFRWLSRLQLATLLVGERMKSTSQKELPTCSKQMGWLYHYRKSSETICGAPDDKGVDTPHFCMQQ